MKSDGLTLAPHNRLSTHPHTIEFESWTRRISGLVNKRKVTKPKKRRAVIVANSVRRSTEFRRIEKAIEARFTKQANKQKKIHDRALRKVTIFYKKKISALTSKYAAEKKLLKKKSKLELNRKSEAFEREFTRLKKTGQLHAEQIRSIYRDQYNSTIAEIRASFNQQIEAANKIYNETADANKVQLTKLQKWLQEELITQLLEKKHQLASAEAEQVRLAAELKISKLKEQLEQRESQIQVSTERMQRLEEKMAGKYARALWSKLRGASQPEYAPSSESQDNNSERGKLMEIVRDLSREKAEIDEKSRQSDRRESEDPDDAVSALLQTWNSDRPRRLE